jgi:hypothetical protein
MQAGLPYIQANAPLHMATSIERLFEALKVVQYLHHKA